MTYVFSRILFSLVYHSKNEAWKRKGRNVSKAKSLETLGIPRCPLPFRTIRTRDRRKYRCRKVEVRGKAHGSQDYSYSSGIRRAHPLSPFRTIRFIRKSCTRNRRSREREHTYENEIDGSFRGRAPPSSALQTFRGFVKSSLDEYIPPFQLVLSSDRAASEWNSRTAFENL